MCFQYLDRMQENVVPLKEDQDDERKYYLDTRNLVSGFKCMD